MLKAYYCNETDLYRYGCLPELVGAHLEDKIMPQTIDHIRSGHLSVVVMSSGEEFKETVRHLMQRDTSHSGYSKRTCRHEIASKCNSFTFFTERGDKGNIKNIKYLQHSLSIFKGGEKMV